MKSEEDWVKVSKKENPNKKNSVRKNYQKYSNTETSSLVSIFKSNTTTPKAQHIQEKKSNIHLLYYTWVLWFHDMKNHDWSLEGYEKLFAFNTVEDFWILYNNINELTDGMYYLMREGYPPIWDHEKNIAGGAWTFKVDKRNLNKFWEDLSCYCVGETICADSNDVVGISISPKIRFATVRVWTSNTNQKATIFDEISRKTTNNSVVIDFNGARFTKNKEASK